MCRSEDDRRSMPSVIWHRIVSAHRHRMSVLLSKHPNMTLSELRQVLALKET
jgi:hypothetical protein